MSPHKSSSAESAIHARRPLVIIVFASIVVLLIIVGVVIDQVGRANRVAEGDGLESQPQIGSIEAVQSVPELRRLHAEAVAKYPSMDLPVKLELVNRRKELCRRILALSNKAEDRQFALVNIMEAQSLHYTLLNRSGMAKDAVRAEMFQMTDEYEKEENLDVRRQAVMSRVAMAYNDLYNEPDSDAALQQFIDLLRETASRFPNDPKVASSFDSLCMSLLGIEALHHRLPTILDVLFDLFHNSDDPQTVRMAHKARDERILRTLDYPSIPRMVYNGNVAGRERMRQMAELLISESASEMAWDRLARDVRLLEGQGWLEDARQIYELFLQGVQDGKLRYRQPLEIGRSVEDTCRAGLQRLKAVQQPIDFAGVDFERRSIDPELLKDRVVWLAFFRNADMLTLHSPLLPRIQEMTSRGLLHVVFVFSSLSVESNPELIESIKWPHSTIVVEPGLSGHFTSQIPTDLEWYFVIVGYDGTVKEIGTLENNLVTKLETQLYLASEEGRQRHGQTTSKTEDDQP